MQIIKKPQEMGNVNHIFLVQKNVHVPVHKCILTYIEFTRTPMVFTVNQRSHLAVTSVQRAKLQRLARIMNMFAWFNLLVKCPITRVTKAMIGLGGCVGLSAHFCLH